MEIIISRAPVVCMSSVSVWNHFWYFCVQNISKNYERILTEVRGEMERGAEVSFRFLWRSGFFSGSWIIFQDSLPLADRA